MHDKFIKAIHAKSKVKISFYSDEDKSVIDRICYPMDYGPGTKIKDNAPRYWVWDSQSDTKPHPLPLKQEQIHGFQVLNETFDPAEFVTWTTAWNIPRGWGIYS